LSKDICVKSDRFTNLPPEALCPNPFFSRYQYETVRRMLKSWIPHILILAPEEFKNSLLKDMKQWIKRQEKE